jgi:hypothetical protein
VLQDKEEELARVVRHQERRTQENNTQHEREQEEMQRTKETLDKQVRERIGVTPL